MNYPSDSLPIVDPRRLDQLRDMVDLDIAAVHLKQQVDRRTAAAHLVAGLGMRLRYCRPRTGYSVAWLDSSECDAPSRSAYTLALCPPRSFVKATAVRCWAADESDSLTAACLLAIEPEADLFYERAEARRFLGHVGLSLILGQEALIEIQFFRSRPTRTEWTKERLVMQSLGLDVLRSSASEFGDLSNTLLKSIDDGMGAIQSAMSGPQFIDYHKDTVIDLTNEQVRKIEVTDRLLRAMMGARAVAIGLMDATSEMHGVG